MCTGEEGALGALGWIRSERHVVREIIWQRRRLTPLRLSRRLLLPLLLLVARLEQGQPHAAIVRARAAGRVE